MRHIPGSKFTNRTTRNKKWFTPNVVYTIKNIKILEDKRLQYIFYTSDGSGEKEIIFSNPEEADNFLDTMLF